MEKTPMLMEYNNSCILNYESNMNKEKNKNIHNFFDEIALGNDKNSKYNKNNGVQFKKRLNIYWGVKIILILNRKIKKIRRKLMIKKLLCLITTDQHLEKLIFDEDERKQKAWNTKILNKFLIKMKKKSKNYFLNIVESTNLNSIIFSYKNYEDDFPLLILRKLILAISRIVKYFCYLIVINDYFSKAILIFIFIDFILLIMNLKEKKYEEIQHIISNIYLFEMIIKMLGYGIILFKDSYFRNKANVIDFIIVSSIYFFDSQNDNDLNKKYSIFRNLIILRLFKINSFNKIIERVLYTFFLLYDTLKLIFTFLIGFSIIGVQLLYNKFKNRCMNELTGIITDNFCGNYACDENYICLRGLDNPNFGITNFDNVFYGILQILKIITLDGWSDSQYIIQQVYSNYMIIYTIILVFFGNFFILNLILAVLKVKYSECNPKSIMEVKNYIQQYEKKIYDLQDLKSKGLYIKDLKTGKIYVGVRKNEKKNSILPVKNNKFEQKKKETSLFRKKIIYFLCQIVKKIFNSKTNVQKKLIKNLKSGRFLSNLNTLNINRNSKNYENIGKNIYEIKPKYKQQYEDENCYDVLLSS